MLKIFVVFVGRNCDLHAVTRYLLLAEFEVCTVSYWLKRFLNLLRRPKKQGEYDIWPFNSQKWLKSYFSQQYPYIIQETGHENTQTYQVEVVVLI